MKNIGRKLLVFAAVWVVSSFLIPKISLASQFTIFFGGGTYGHSYSTPNLSVSVGDTIIWQGGGSGEDFTKYDLRSTSIPQGADSIGPVTSGNTYLYVIRIPGEYDYGSKIWAQLGMTGTIIAKPIHNGLSNEGREFYLGMIYPNYNTLKNPYFHTYAMINSFYPNVISVTYFDDLGNEYPAKTFRIGAKQALKLPLDTGAMHVDIISDVPQYKSCHIVAKYPITVEYLSVGECSGGSYLALPVDGLGKNYVTASYNDDPGDGALLNPIASAGAFMVIATADGTSIQITPSTTTSNGHTGAIHGSGSGSPVPYTKVLNRGQVYFARSKGDDNENDMSGSIIQSNLPIVVLSGQENALIGGVNGAAYESRDFMVEQMVPYELWDSTGYISIPFVSPNGSISYEGYGDKYRAFVYDGGTIPITFNYDGIADPQATTKYRFASPNNTEKDIDGSTPMVISSPKKISVMEYDERSQPLTKPWPAPSMMTVVPKSHWKKYFALNTLDNSDRTRIIDMPYVNIISDNIEQIQVAVGNTPFVQLKAAQPNLSLSISYPAQDFFGSDDLQVQGRTAKLAVPIGTPPVPYYFQSDFPFMVYFYEMRIIADPTNTVPTEYAAPAGMLLNTGGNTNFRMSIDNTTKCGTWHICVQDTSKNNPGIKAVQLVDDPEGFFFKPGGTLRNASFDPTVPEYSDATGELHPNLANPSAQYCFDINVNELLDTALAPVAIVDNNGNASYFILQYNPPALKITLDPPMPGRGDSIAFPVQKTTVGQKICSSFVLINTAPVGGAPITIVAEHLKNSQDNLYTIENPPLFPHTIAPQDTMRFEICYTPTDTLRHRDSVIIQTDCLGFPISLDAHGRTGLIYAYDEDFGNTNVDGSTCKDILVKNIGSAPLHIDSLILSDRIDFTISSQTLTSLPITIPAGGATQLSLCFNPKQESPYSEQLTIVTDLSGDFANQIKSYSYLTGTGVLRDAVPAAEPTANDPIIINPNPASGSYITLRFEPQETKSILRIADVLGRVVYQKEILQGSIMDNVFIGNLKAGGYSLVLISDKGVVSQKLEVVR